LTVAGELTIQRAPRGLLHALAMKGSGRTPDSLTSELVPTFDATVLYFGDNVRSASGTSAAINLVGTFSANLAVPTGEIWLVNNVTVTMPTLGAGYELVPYFARRSAATLLLALPGRLSATTGQAPALGVQLQDPYSLVLYPADSFGVYCVGGTFGIPAAATVICDYVRLEV
jgi:hypothetical protein